MILTFRIDGITEKDADDICQDVLRYLYEECGLMVGDYTVEEE